MVSRRKHFSDMLLGFYSRGILLMHPANLKNLADLEDVAQEVIENSHIYLIVTRPKVAFVPSTLKRENGVLSGEFAYTVNGLKATCPFEFRDSAELQDFQIGPYPHNYLILQKQGSEPARFPAHIAVMRCRDLGDETLRDLKVEYVGMAYADGRRTAADRLLNHGTLQQVLADLNHDAPDQEALIIMVEYEPPQVMINFAGNDPSVNIDGDRDAGADLRRTEDELTEEFQIPLIEAGLIRYFSPHYNEKYKLKFPNPKQKLLDKVYEIDFSALAVEINSEDIHARLFSEAKKPGFHHLAQYDLHDPAVRRSFFDMFESTRGVTADDASGPVY